MNDTLEAMLSPLVTEYYLESVLSLNRKLEMFGMTDHHFEIEQIIGLQDMYSNEPDLVMRLTDVLKYATWRVFGGYGIIVEDALLSNYIPLLDTLLALETTVTLAEMDESLFKNPGVAEVATLVNIITSEPEENVLEWLVEVSPKDIAAIFADKMEVLTIPSKDEIAIRKGAEKVFRRISQLLNQFPKVEHGYIVEQLIEQGQPFKSAYNPILEEFMDELDYMAISQRAYELYLLYLYTDHGFDDVQGLVADYTADMSEYQSIVRHITPYLDNGVLQ